MMNWREFLGLFLLIAGFVLGLGGVTVIDIHGLLARKSAYWTEVTIKTHKITKPLIWFGIFLLSVGSILYYPIVGTWLLIFQFTLIFILIGNGLFLTFKVSPHLLKKEAEKKTNQLLEKTLQKKIAISFLVSFLGWWTSLLVLVWHLATKN